MARFNLYRKGRYGWYHVTSNIYDNLYEAIKGYKKDFGIKIGKELFNYKVTGLNGYTNERNT